MTIQFIKWKDWEAIECTFDNYELIVGVSAGPRILSFGFKGGKNVLYEDHTNFRVGEWRMYGGHRFTIAPENNESYYPDNEPCDVNITGTSISISQKQRLNGIRLSITISMSAKKEGFDILHTLENDGSANWEGALWAITCVPRSAQLFALCDTSALYFWPGTDTSNWENASEQLTVKPGPFRGKIGWYSKFPELKAIQQQSVFIITNPDLPNPDLCIDNGSNTEIFVCADYAELETLSEKLVVAPRESIHHLQYWRLEKTL